MTAIDETAASPLRFDSPGWLEYGLAGFPIEGETETGDRGLIKSLNGSALIVVVDGLGHGHEASVAAEVALRTIGLHPEEPLARLVELSHDRLVGTRGVVMSLVTLDPGRRQWTTLSIGNIETVICRKDNHTVPSRHYPLRSPGMVGYRLPATRTSTVDAAPGDTLIITTDGIVPGHPLDGVSDHTPQEFADLICRNYARHTDDGLVLVARFKDL